MISFSIFAVFGLIIGLGMVIGGTLLHQNGASLPRKILGVILYSWGIVLLIYFFHICSYL